jgi:hypothetical protein
MASERCDCKVTCCLHVYADDMLETLYRYASECADCGGEGEVVVSSVQRDVDWWDETKGPCSACADIRELIKRVDPCGDFLTRNSPPSPPQHSTEEESLDIPF